MSYVNNFWYPLYITAASSMQHHFSSKKRFTSTITMSYQGTGDRPDLNNHANQLNPNNVQFGGGVRPAGSGAQSAGGYQGTGDRPDLNNHANQLNPNNGQFGGGVQRPAGSGAYQGIGDRPDLNNHASQLNPNNAQFGGGVQRR